MESRLERYIQDYVLQKTAEKVELYLSDAITVKHVTRKGSITLAIFWANLLQHTDNFPPSKHTYKRMHDKSAGSDKLVLKTQDITFTVFMKTGALVIQGPYVYQWFTHHFRDLLDHWDGLEFGSSWVFSPRDMRPVVAQEVEEAEGNDHRTATEEYLLMMTKRHVVDPKMEKQIKQYEDVIPGLAHLAVDQSLWTDNSLEQQLEGLTSGRLCNGAQFLYRLWRSLVSHWLSIEGARVYLASPQLDERRLRDIIHIYLKHRHVSSDIEVFYTNQKCGHSGTRWTGAIQKEAASELDNNQKVYIEYRVFRKMLYPLQKFNGKFIARVNGGQTEVLVTSASFNGDSFDSNTMEMAYFTKMPEEYFIKKYVDPLSEKVVATHY